MSINKVILIGNVGKDPEVRYLDQNAPAGQGRKVASFTLATSERYRDRNGETKENTDCHNIVVWGQSADIVEKYVKKGSQLYVEGKLRNRSWTDQSGNKRYTTEVNADSIQLLGRKDDSPVHDTNIGTPISSSTPNNKPFTPPVQASPRTQQGSWTTTPVQPVDPKPEVDSPEDDLPF